MAMNSPNTMLKIVWTAHFVLSSWGMMSGFIGPATYWYTHVGALAFGFWAIVDQKSIDAVLMFLVCLVVSVINDMMLIAIYQPRAYDTIEKPAIPQSVKNEYRWALGMAITNLLIKPITIYIMYKVYQSRAHGTEFTYKVPDGIPGFSSARGAYSDLDEPEHRVSTPTYQQPPLHSEPAYKRPPSVNSTSSYHDSGPDKQHVDSQDQSEA